MRPRSLLIGSLQVLLGAFSIAYYWQVELTSWELMNHWMIFVELQANYVFVMKWFDYCVSSILGWLHCFGHRSSVDPATYIWTDLPNALYLWCFSFIDHRFGLQLSHILFPYLCTWIFSNAVVICLGCVYNFIYIKSMLILYWPFQFTSTEKFFFVGNRVEHIWRGYCIF